ncbi:hypothetical protein AN639_12105 [Candidatus Epulonipiscium fishelsonii]|uniref:Uncharacterized protein n=1 Tax=Candidatus Epulonipiscium fishelsonii TaxID=77094 RepID=A0ACC8X7M0_9FIRM|nr:hypothetical protein AN396_12545 [Epulopiscium sp. SCG-B11WGA-EpuloA1]ONI42670.1 hypothetical protein AN639_12105 [Epulopiscium sp. SCG-B05WGA-EpuloA1]
MEYAVIDIGSNTIRLCIYKKEEKGFSRLLNTKATAGLAGYRKDEFMTREGIDKACEVLTTFKNTLSIIQVKKLFVFATASLRNIINNKHVIKEIEHNTGFEIDLISGELEAKLGFLGASKANNLENGLLMDIGGGSTELVEYKNGEIKSYTSLALGSLSLYSTFISGLIPNKKEQKLMEEHVNVALKEVSFIKNKNIDTILGIGGSIRTIRKMCNKKYSLKDNKLKYEYLYDLINFTRENKKQTIDLMLKVAPERVHTAIPGMIIANEIARYVHAKYFIVSNFGLREGYLYYKLKGDAYEK